MDLLAGVSLAESQAAGAARRKSSFESNKPGDLTKRPSRKSVSALEANANKNKTPEELKAQAIERIGAVLENAVGGVLVITEPSELTVDPMVIRVIFDLLHNDEYATDMVVILVDGEPEMDALKMKYREIKMRFNNTINLDPFDFY